MSKKQISARRVVCELHHIKGVHKPVDNFALGDLCDLNHMNTTACPIDF